MEDARHDVVLFVLIAFALDWALWIGAGIASGGMIEGALWSALLPLSMYGPLVAALVLLKAGRVKVGRGWHPAFRGHILLYLAALLVPTLLAVAGAAVYFCFVPGDFDGTLASFAAIAEAQLGADPSQVPALFATQMASAALLAPFFNVLFAIGEEAGWRGYLYPMLKKLLPARRAALATGVIWGAWHAPLIAMGYNYGRSYPGFPVVGILLMVLFCTAFGIFLSWLRDRSSSVWPSALAHGALNATASLGIWFSRDGQGILGPAPLGLLAVIPVLVLAAVLLRNLSGGAEPEA